MITFPELSLKPEILHAIAEMGFVNPTPVQAKAIPTILENDGDVIALAQTGTGKTAAFGLPIIERIDVNNLDTQCLILCPTRELCVQIAKELTNFSKYVEGLVVTAVYGGTPIQPQMQMLRRGAQIVVGTPGRTLDLVKRRALKVENIAWLALDEADEMLNMGFKEDLDEILTTTPATKRTLLFSATMPRTVEQMSRKYMNNTIKLELAKRNSGNRDVNHLYYMVPAKHRYAALKRIADVHPDIYSIVFCRTRQETKDISEKLVRDGYNADSLHGDLSQAQRDHVMGKFRSKSISLLVATDVAARGLDVTDLTHVINYNLPDDLEAYVHRSGRTGRAGKKGTSVAIVHSREGGRIRSLQKMLDTPFERAMVPSGSEVCEKQLYNLIDNVKQTPVDQEMIDPYMGAINEKLESLSRDELIKCFVSVEFNRFLDYYKGAEDINMDEDKRRETRERGSSRGQDENFSRMFINQGKLDNLNPTKLIGLINDTTGRRDIEIGKIDIMKKFSFFDADKSAVELLLSSFKGIKSETGFDISIEVTKPEANGGRTRSQRSFGGGGGGRSYGGGNREGGRSGGGSREGRSGGSREGRSYGGRSEGRSGGGSREGRSGGSREGGRSRDSYRGDRS